jgi:DNA repair protein SbcC/Rad50
MKPIKLTIAGLHSFREKQEIDFATLCEGGVFGIFGPTGSGKSSILDAMTLALYGKVERAVNNTQGIMNHAENQLSVSFIFELENADGKKQYLIERSFKRTDEVRIKASTCRLIELGEESVVLADKTNEVNEKIHQLLGLTIDDFTRAVVLPQGKFAEFLSLKGTERRQMLQRLFNLEQYGDRLNQKVKQKLAKAKAEYNELIAEQAGLGDASKEAVDEAEMQLKECEILLQKRQTELKQMEESYEKMKQIWQWQQEKAETEKQLQALDSDKGDILELEQKIQKAEQAEKIKPYLEEYENSKELLSNWQRKVSELSVRLKQTKAEYEEAQNRYHVARQKKAEEEPKLIAKKEQLLAAKELLQKNQLEEQQLEVLLRKQEDIQRQLLEKEKEKEKVEDLLTRGIEKQKKLKEELEKVSTPAEVREQIQTAYDEKLNIERMQTNLKELEETFKEKQEMANESIKERENIEKELKYWNEKAREQYRVMLKLYHQVCDKESAFNRVMQKIGWSIEKEKSELEKTKIHELAANLALQLKDGEPCPVCGSLEHPQPVQPLKESHCHLLERAIQTLEGLLAAGAEKKQEIYSLKFHLEQLSQTFVEQFENDISLVSNETLPPLNDIEETANVEEFQQFFADFAIEIKGFHQDYLALKERLHQLIHKHRELEQKRSHIDQAIQFYQEELAALNKKIEMQSDLIKKEYERWQERFPIFRWEEIFKQYEQQKEYDRLRQQLAERIDRSVSFIEEKEKEFKALAEQYHELEKQRIDLSATIKLKDAQIQETKRKIQEITQEDKLDEHLFETNQQLNEIIQKEKIAYENWLEIQQFYQTLEGDLKAASHALEESKNRFAMAEQKWIENKNKAFFESDVEVKSALLPEDIQAAYKANIEAYWNQIKQLQSRLHKLKELLAGKEITEEQWREKEQLLIQQKESVRTAFEEKGAAAKALQVLLEKHERYMELEKQKETLETLINHLSKLQSVLKGNSFVEFIAEEQLAQVSRQASERLGSLTRQRYAIEVDSQGGFIIRDDANGGVKRPVTTLSGGETFLTSLALALSLSAQIQLRGEYPLQFFFLDEGFGTLDAELLDTVVTSLEKLQSQQLSVGVISHVQELRARLPKRLIVEPAEPSGRGSRVRIETL